MDDYFAIIAWVSHGIFMRVIDPFPIGNIVVRYYKS